jgi:hypothetical protein
MPSVHPSTRFLTRTHDGLSKGWIHNESGRQKDNEKVEHRELERNVKDTSNG